jgi:hypothetical protein
MNDDLKGLGRNGHNLIEVLFSELFGRTGENHKKPVMIGDLPVEIRKDNFSNPS